MGEEHVWQAVGFRIALFEPVLYEDYSFEQVSEPGAQGLQGWIGHFHPVEGLLVVLDSQVHLIKLIAHDNETFDGEVDVCQRSFHFVEKSVELLHFL